MMNTYNGFWGGFRGISLMLGAFQDGNRCVVRMLRLLHTLTV